MGIPSPETYAMPSAPVSTSEPLPVATDIFSGIMTATGPIGAVIGFVTQGFKLLGISIRGSTQHLSQAAVEPVAKQFAEKVYPVFASTYTPAQLLNIQKVTAARFVLTMGEVWGRDTSANQTIVRDLTDNAGMTGNLYRQLWLFVIWIGINIDQERPETFNTFMRDLFQTIFLQGITDAGEDAGKLAAKIQNLPEVVAAQPDATSQSQSSIPTTTTGAGYSLGLTGKSGGTLSTLLLLGAGAFIISKAAKFK